MIEQDFSDSCNRRGGGASRPSRLQVVDLFRFISSRLLFTFSFPRQTTQRTVRKAGLPPLFRCFRALDSIVVALDDLLTAEKIELAIYRIGLLEGYNGPSVIENPEF